MNIQEAKEEIEKAVRAYTAKTASGSYRIPVKRQRPVLLIGPPGIGKTAIMEQIARECSLGLVAYTMTHHTRQSAIGLPVLEQKTFEGKEYTVTSYTMSEIIASVYEQEERSGCREGILFLDEINCVSETLMPAMLQFLQYKTFGSHKLPDGWVIVAAGNPPAYNRSVREFDTVTLDRVRRMEVDPDLGVWKHYAVQKGLHPAVLSFLELRPERFYVMEAGQDGFVTGRAWEDLSEILLTMEELSLGVEETLFEQYLQDEDTALEFALYYRIFEKWKDKLLPERILSSEAEAFAGEAVGKGLDFSILPSLPFDERLCIVWLLLQRLHAMGQAAKEQKKLSDSLRYFADGLGKAEEGCEKRVEERLASRRRALEVRRENGLLSREEEECEQRFLETVRQCREKMRLSADPLVFQEQSAAEAQEAKALEQELALSMECASEFVRNAFGDGQELVVFLTGITEDLTCRAVMKQKAPKLYERAKELLGADRREEELKKKLLDLGQEKI